MIDWDIVIGSSRDDHKSTHDVHITVKVPDELIVSLGREDVQHEIVNYVSRRLHEFVAAQFARKALPSPRLELQTRGKCHRG